MRTRLAATMALLTSTALAGAAFASTTGFETNRPATAEIQLAQSDAASSAADQGQPGVRVGPDAEQPEDLQTEAGVDTPTDQGQPGGSGEAPDAQMADDPSAGPDSPTFAGDQGQPGEQVTGEEGDSTMAMDETGDYRSYSASPEAGGAVLPEGHSVEDYLERDIVNAEGEEIGEVVDLMIDANNNITKVVAETGGFLGIGESHVAIDMANVDVAEGSDDLTVEMSREEIEALPTYELDEGVWTPVRD